MTPKEYEFVVAAHFERDGWATRLTPDTNDYGVDVFATKGSETLAIQAKMYGGSARVVNREMIMHLHGAKDYFDCTKAVLVTNGRIAPDAAEVAAKLGIELLHVAGDQAPAVTPERSSPLPTNDKFEEIWRNYIMPLEGRTLTAPDGRTNVVLRVDWSGIQRRTSNGGRGTIPIEIFRLTVTHLLRNGTISRRFINDQYAKRASSGIVLVLSQVPMFEFVPQPIGLRLRKTENVT